MDVCGAVVPGLPQCGSLLGNVVLKSFCVILIQEVGFNVALSPKPLSYRSPEPEEPIYEPQF